MKRFFRNLLLFVSPFLVLLIVYIIVDPNKKIWSYDIYLSDYQMLNRGDVSTRVYLKNRGKYPFNSFILGSSRSCAFPSTFWSAHLSKKDVAYSYGSWNEPIEGIYNKLALIDSLNSPIDNALIIIDADRTFADLGYNPLNGDHYLISKKTLFDYHFWALRNYYKNPLLVVSSIDYSLFHKRRSYMKEFIGQKPESLDPINNDWSRNGFREDHDPDSVNSYKKIANKFYKRPTTQRYAKPQITKHQESVLYNMKRLFDKHDTRYKIVISPLYDQIKLNPADLAILNRIFKKESVYDYAGINNKTQNIRNFAMDVVHYRQKIGLQIMNEIYRSKKNNGN